MTHIVKWPGLHIVKANGDPVATTFQLNYLSAAGTLLLIAGLISMVLIQIRPRRGLASTDAPTTPQHRARGRTRRHRRTTVQPNFLIVVDRTTLSVRQP
ncbi:MULTISPECIES: hypothetical protein [unclassified Streptomyces]|uniref:hypothetical protein n=1 Tax=unclassified Streptomyces TaxID=2593676 RepID=UPI003D928267